MNLQEIIIKPEKEPESLHGPDNKTDDIELVQFKDDDKIDRWLRELCVQLSGLENQIQIRMVLKLYLEDMLKDVRWGGTQV